MLLGPLHFPVNPGISLSISIQKPAENLTEFALTLYINWGRIDIVTMLSFLTHEHNTSFHLVGFSLTFSILSAMFHSFQSIGPAHHFPVFLIFQCYCKCYFKFSISDCSWLICRYNVCILALYPSKFSYSF